MSLLKGDIRVEVTLSDFAGNVARAGKLSVGNTFELNDGELLILSGVDVLDLVPVSFGNSRNSVETVLGSTDRKRGVVVSRELAMAIFLNRNFVSRQGGTHQDMASEFGGTTRVVLRHNSTKRVGSEEPVVSMVTFVSQSANSILDVAIDQTRLNL